MLKPPFNFFASIRMAVIIILALATITAIKTQKVWLPSKLDTQVCCFCAIDVLSEDVMIRKFQNGCDGSHGFNCPGDQTCHLFG